MDILTFPGLLTVLAVVFMIEGLLPALFPNKWRAYIQQLASQSSTTIRSIGLMMVFIGVVILLLVRT